MDTREKILNTARDEFSKRGLDGARVDRIARLAKVNKAMIYYHFRSKEKLYQAVIERHVEKIGVFLENNLIEDCDLEEFLLKLANFYNTMTLDKQGFVPIILREMARGGETIRAAFTKTIAEKGIIKKLKKMIDAGIASGHFRHVDSMHAMMSFWGMNMFYLMMAPVINSVWEIKDDEKFRKDRPAHVVELFLYGLKAR
jgi:TetR/AcrR family transcriptional regulator